MPREKSIIPAAPLWDAPNPHELKLQIKVITPMFGGGYNAREVDPVCIIRPAAIRGQLRFWWRATQGTTYSSAEKLFQEEEKLWGSSEKPGRVSLQVQNVANANDVVRIDRAKAGVPKYISAILTQEKSKTDQTIRREVKNAIDREARQNEWDEKRQRQELRNAQEKALQKKATTIDSEKDQLYPFILPAGATFDLLLVLNEDRTLLNDVARALKAFVLFGGVGGRTRRGHGSLESVFLPNEVSSLRIANHSPWFQGVMNPPPGCVSLNRARLYKGKKGYADPLQAWLESIEIFRNFRKAELPDQNRPQSKEGSHSTWPEADMIRQLKNPSIAPLNPTFVRKTKLYSFPRAQLGLPLAFHSMPRHTRAFGDTELYLSIDTRETSRLASPVILKPFKLNGEWYPSVLILNTTPIRQGDLRVKVDPSATINVDPTGSPVSLWNERTKKENSFSHSHSSVLDVLEEYLTNQAKWTKLEIGTL